jgi:hypothetical protein
VPVPSQKPGQHLVSIRPPTFLRADNDERIRREHTPYGLVAIPAEIYLDGDLQFLFTGQSRQGACGELGGDGRVFQRQRVGDHLWHQKHNPRIQVMSHAVRGLESTLCAFRVGEDHAKLKIGVSLWRWTGDMGAFSGFRPHDEF